MDLAQASSEAAGPLLLVWGLERPIAWVSTLVAVLAFWRFFPLNRHRAFAWEANPGLGLQRAVLLFAPLWFWWVLATAADGQIAGFYTWMYAALAAACLLVGSLWRPILGIWSGADTVERGNLAASVVLAGFILGTAFAFGGALSGQDASCSGDRMDTARCQAIADAAGEDFPPGSVGSGGWHVVLVFFLLAYIELRASVTMVDRIGGGLARQARVDRDVSAGILLAAVAISCGLVAGRAAAGDFFGWKDAFIDYGQRIWPILAIPPLACIVGVTTTEQANRMAVRTIAGALLVAGSAAWYIFT